MRVNRSAYSMAVGVTDHLIAVKLSSIETHSDAFDKFVLPARCADFGFEMRPPRLFVFVVNCQKGTGIGERVVISTRGGGRLWF